MLNKVRELVSHLNDGSINYCHWKSNIHIKDACNGIGDLDILFDKKDFNRVSSLLNSLGFKRLESGLDRRFPGIEDYIGLDSDSGKIIHLQAHYSLVTGQALVKDYHFAFENLVLEHCKKDDVTQLMIPSKDIESVIHLFRTIIKIDYLKILRPRIFHDLSKKARAELIHLSPSFSEGQQYFFNTVLPEVDFKLYKQSEKVILDSNSKLKWIMMRFRFLKFLRNYRRHGRLRSFFIWLTRRIYIFINNLFFKKPPRRKLSAGGIAIAVVGSDGSGKSTAVRNISQWLSEYLEVIVFHMGKPRKSIGTFILAYLVSFISKINDSLSMPKPQLKKTIWPNLLAWIPALLLIFLAKDRLRCFKKGRSLVAKGYIVIFDRYPLEDLEHMEVPQVHLVISDQTIFGRWLSAYEKKIYRKISSTEITLLLSIEPELAAERQPGDGKEYVVKRAKAVQEFLANNRLNISVFNSEDSIKTITRKIFNEIWLKI